MKSKITGFDQDMIDKINRTDRHALKTFVECGAGYFNPFLGHTDTQTFAKLEMGMQFLTECLGDQFDLIEGRPGLALLAQTMWAACQFEGYRPDGESEVE